MNYKIMAGFLVGVVFMTGFTKWDGDFRRVAHIGLAMLAIAAGAFF